VNPNAPDATPCDDGNICTENDACTSGVCVGVNVADGTACGKKIIPGHHHYHEYCFGGVCLVPAPTPSPSASSGSGKKRSASSSNVDWTVLANLSTPGAPVTFRVLIDEQFTFANRFSSKVRFSFEPSLGAPAACEETGSFEMPLRFKTASCTVRFSSVGVWTPSVRYQTGPALQHTTVSLAPAVLVRPTLVFQQQLEATPEASSTRTILVYAGSRSLSDPVAVGSVSFSTDGVALCSAALQPDARVSSVATAQCSATFSGQGPWRVLASYAGDNHHGACNVTRIFT